jgi:hypothetical protein
MNERAVSIQENGALRLSGFRPFHYSVKIREPLTGVKSSAAEDLAGDDQPLDLARPFADRAELGITPELFDGAVDYLDSRPG